VVRVALDESALTGKLTPESQFLEGDVRGRYFAGDRLRRTIERVEQVRATVGNQESNMVAAALKFALKPRAVTTVIPGIRNVRQAEMNLAISEEAPLSDDVERQLRSHNWRRGFWYSGK
jgi:aryl-alcohol dehydrogenase-like predicted oxidoreductase